FSRDLIISYSVDSLPGDIVKKAGGTLLPTPRYISYEELLRDMKIHIKSNNFFHARKRHSKPSINLGFKGVRCHHLN
ncbi:MAG: hypothetical protein LBV23_11535, partial [Deltaproteobacteria bacterium]|nr:hypothetical protein [Deltaproteobacteria bacterium]